MPWQADACQTKGEVLQSVLSAAPPQGGWGAFRWSLRPSVRPAVQVGLRQSAIRGGPQLQIWTIDITLRIHDHKLFAQRAKYGHQRMTLHVLPGLDGNDGLPATASALRQSGLGGSQQPGAARVIRLPNFGWKVASTYPHWYFCAVIVRRLCCPCGFLGSSCARVFQRSKFSCRQRRASW